MVPSDFPSSEPLSLSISCVTFNTNQLILERTIESLAESCEAARQNNSIARLELFFIDNGPDEKNLSILHSIRNKYQNRFDAAYILTEHGNVGYGRGNNLAINTTSCLYHLVINPDIIVAKKNISAALAYMTANNDVGMLAPCAQDENGHAHYIAKRYPGFMVLLARALKISLVQKLLHKRLYHYEYRDKIPAQDPFEIELASGCYMFCRTSALKKVGGFDPRFFMYFEDFDLSIRFRQTTKIMHLPELHVIHFGGDASAKGWRHIFYFCASLCQFFWRHHIKF